MPSPVESITIFLCSLYLDLLNQKLSAKVFSAQFFIFYFKFFIEEGGVSMKIRPLNDRILVKRLEEEEKTAGGIIIPDSAKEKPAEGKIVAVGPGKLGDSGERTAIDLKVGDKVLFSKYGGTDVKFDGEDYLIMREDDILGVLEQ